MSLILISILSLWQGLCCHVIDIGLVIEPNRTTEISAVTYAVQFSNVNILTNDTIILTVFKTDPNNSIQSSIQQTCALVAAGKIAQIGPARSTNVAAVAPILSRLKIPIIAPVATSPALASYTDTIFMVPSSAVQGKAIASILKKMAWSRVNLISSDDEYGTYGLLSFIEISSVLGWYIASMQSFATDQPTHNITSRLDVIKHSGCRVTILNCLYLEAKYVLNEANARGMIGQGWIWIVTDGVTNSGQFLPSSSVPQYLQGIIGTGYPTLSGGLAAQFQAEWSALDPVTYPGAQTPTITTSVSRWADAVLALAYVVRDFGLIVAPSGLSCTQGNTWLNGTAFIETIKNVSQPAVSQNIKFIGNYPSEAKYSVYNSRSTGWVEIATWDPTAEYQSINSEAITLPGGLPASPDFVSSINEKHLRIVTIRRIPFYFYPDGVQPRNLNNINPGVEMIGHGVDMLLEMSRILNFTFTLYHVPDGNFGGKNITSGYWSGMVGELVGQKADFVFAPLTINKIRELDIDFSYPYMDIGLAFGLSRDGLPRFMKPFHKDVWIGVGVSMLLVGIALSLLEKLSPHGYHGEFVHEYHNMAKMNLFRNRRYFRRQADDAHSVMRMDNAVWFSLAALIQQGYDRYPQALSSRVISICWFLAILALTSVYTAQLGAVLITSRLQGSVNTVQELFDQDRIRYGVGKDTSTEDFFCNSKIPLYRNMCLNMRKWDSWAYNTEQGLQWLQDPNYAYAFAADAPVIASYTQMKPCTIRQLAEVFNPNGLGVGMQKGSPYYEVITQTIIQLRENKFMDDLYTKWFTNRSECLSENKVLSDVEKNRAKLTDLKGIFYVFMAATCISPVLLLLEFVFACIREYKISLDAGISTNPCVIFFSRCRRILRDFTVYVIPDSLKGCLGLHDSTVSRRREKWLTRAENHKNDHLNHVKDASDY